MAAAIKAINARIRANPVSDYLCSTHFWGPASNFGIPIAAVMDTQKDPEIISGPMTLALIGYSGTFMRYALAVTPKNYLLFGCHIVNFSAQSTQAYRYVNHHYMGGKQQLEGQVKEGLNQAGGAMETGKGKVEAGVESVREGVKQGAAEVKAQVDKVVR
ncbi:hypothetical protein LTR62_005506 [Meristemomyces frigidus]|uniref:Mitochondrial pyruvate carrier n=1 Tax=Meristemomyces frigidus TaxID=1508187 RepID=A0AAN7YNE8_9PEZI|nr:hypothetical protein LTR62_005506 [Meristemomyces frigidus]